MTERILKSSISVFDSFNAVRNDHSLAHDNEMLGPDEAQLILDYVISCIRFVQSVEARPLLVSALESEFDDIPF